MIDIHCHVLPAISGDDGAGDSEAAEQMLNLAAGEGISSLICTPHFSQKGLSDIPRSAELLRSPAAAVNIQIHTGTEYKFSNLLNQDFDQLVTLADTRFLLIDFAMNTLPPAAEKIAYDLHSKGYHLIAAHPERLFNDKKDFERLAGMGFYFQITSGVLLGKFGNYHMNLAYQLIASGYCHYIASDAHGEHRPFHMKACYERLADRFGEDFANLVFHVNPQRLLDNKAPLNPYPHKRNFIQYISDIVRH